MQKNFQMQNEHAPRAPQHRNRHEKKIGTADSRRTVTEREAAARHATDAQVLEDAEGLIAAWNERQAKRMPISIRPHDWRGPCCSPLVFVGFPHSADVRFRG